MTAEVVLAAAALTAGAVVVMWPVRRRLPSADGGLTARAWATLPRTVAAAWHRHPRWPTPAAAVAGAVCGAMAAGPVLAAVAAGYAALGARAALRHARARAEAAARSRALDTLGAVAAELRAGLPPAAVLPDPGDGAAPGPASQESGDDRFRHLTGAVWHLAEQTGAPAADLVERIEADARAADRARATAAAQGAGAQATAVLLAALPLGGIALGYLIGADPLAVLLHTPIGAGCALGALALQTAGLAWSDRLARAGRP